jgi:hypothetical protein
MAKPLFIVKPFTRDGEKFYYIHAWYFGRYLWRSFTAHAEARARCEEMKGDWAELTQTEIESRLAKAAFVWTVNEIFTGNNNEYRNDKSTVERMAH